VDMNGIVKKKSSNVVPHAGIIDGMRREGVLIKTKTFKGIHKRKRRQIIKFRHREMKEFQK
jgi:hypothetical protein